MIQKAQKAPDLKNDFQNSARELLESTWNEVLATEDQDNNRGPLGDLIYEVLSNSGVTFPYMLVTQVLGKATDSSLNALCIQRKAGGDGAWDARSLAKPVVSRWNKDAGCPFKGNNDDPYVNNPGRNAKFGTEMRSSSKNREMYDKLYELVCHADKSGDAAKSLLKDILVEVKRLQQNRSHQYVGPLAASLDDVMSVLEKFLSYRSSGVRLQSVCLALFETLSATLSYADEIRSEAVNASDKATLQGGDIELLNKGKITHVIEVKDRPVTVADVEAAIQKARVANVDDILFLIRANKLCSDGEDAHERAAREFAKGISVNLLDVMQYIKNTLALLGTNEKSEFLRHVHVTLEKLKVDYSHVKAWIDLTTAM